MPCGVLRRAPQTKRCLNIISLPTLPSCSTLDVRATLLGTRVPNTLMLLNLALAVFGG